MPQSPPERSRGSSLYALTFALAILATAIAFLFSLLAGPTDVTLGDFFWSLRAYDASNDAHLVARDIRLPRALLGLLVGGSLAGAGAVMQGVTRNPLAGPSIMGLSGGASLASLIALISVPGLSYNGSIAASLVGAVAAYGCVLAVALMSPAGFSPTRLTLAGAVTSALFSALTQGLVIVFEMSSSMLFWTVGGIANVTWPQVVAITPLCFAGLVMALFMAPSITVLSLGEEVAIGLGQRSAWVRVVAMVSVLLLTGGAVAVAGPVAFVGLMVPHIGRLWVGADYRRLIPLSVVVGAGLVEVADLGSRTVFGSGGEMPLGLLTAALGAPCFVWLIRGRGGYRLDRGVPSGSVGRSHWPLRVAFPVLVATLLLLMLLSIRMGNTDLPFDTIARSFVGTVSPEADLVLWSFRIPRIVFAVLVGAGIAVSGAVLQGVLRNDLAEPGILGISSGAGLAVVLLLGTMGYASLQSILVLPAVSICGALAALLLVTLLCLGSMQSSPRLLLTGVAVSSAISSLSLLVSLRISSEAHAFAIAFSAGSLSAAGWNYVFVLAVWLGLLVPLAWSFAPTLNVLRLGEYAATGLGVAVGWWAFFLLFLSVALCAVCMAFAGGVIFLGLIAPHIARRLVGSDHGAVIPASALVGACLLLLADTLGGQILPQAEIPAGVMVSALGAPYFLYLLTRS